MKRRALLVFSLFAALSLGQAEEAAQSIASAMPGTLIKGIRPSVINGLYEVIAGNNVLYVDPSGRYLVVGSIYDLKEDKDLSAERRQEIVATAGAVTTAAVELPKIAVVAVDILLRDAITIGEGSQSLTVLTDPSCGWCRRLWIETLNNLDGVTVHHLLLNKTEQAVGILCASDPAMALQQAFALSATSAKTPVPRNECRQAAAQKLARVQRFAAKVGVVGTPVLIRADGAIHAGYLSRSALLTWLDAKSDEI